jgi:hypothetical protein
MAKNLCWLLSSDRISKTSLRLNSVICLLRNFSDEYFCNVLVHGCTSSGVKYGADQLAAELGRRAVSRRKANSRIQSSEGTALGPAKAEAGRMKKTCSAYAKFGFLSTILVMSE